MITEGGRLERTGGWFSWDRTSQNFENLATAGGQRGGRRAACDHAAPSRAHAGCGAATASGDAPHDGHTNVGWPGAAVRLGHISCRPDLGCCGPWPLSGRAGCTEKVQCLTGGDASGGTTTLGRGEGSTEGGARPFAKHVDAACLAKHVDAASHGR